MAQSDDINLLKSDVEAIKAELSEVLTSIKKTLNEGENAYQSTQGHLNDFLGNFQERFNISKQESQQILQDLSAIIIKNPIKSIALTLAVGYLLGKFLASRNT